MNIGPELRSFLLRHAGAPESTRGKNGIHLELQTGSAAPAYHAIKGWTHWKNRTPRAYHRAEYKVTVGQEWLVRQFPIAFVKARLKADETVDIDFFDLYQPTYKPSARGCSLDAEEDARLFA